MLEPSRVLILGGAKSVFDDMRQAQAMCTFDAVIAINDIGFEIPEIDYWCSMHPDKLALKWLPQRRDNGYPDPKSLWTSRDKKVPNDIEFQTLKNTRGGSGLLAIHVARYLNFSKIVLAGVPMEAEGEHYHTPGKWKECKLYRIVWEADKSLKHDVRSFSGWTRDTYGVPTADWLMI